MQRRVAAVAAVCLLGGPTALAFFSGGYYTQPRLIAAIVAWVLVLALAAPGPAPLPRSRAGGIAVAGLARADRLERGLVRLGAAGRPGGRRACSGSCSTSARCWWRSACCAYPRALRAARAGAGRGRAVVIGYGLAGRLLPGDHRARPLAQRRRAARAADHLLERRGRARRDRPRPVRAAGRRPHAPAGDPRAPPRRPRSRSARACTSPTRAARSPPPCWASSCSSPRRLPAASCGPRCSRSPRPSRSPSPPPRSPASRRSRARSTTAAATARSRWPSPSSLALAAALVARRADCAAGDVAVGAPPRPGRRGWSSRS